MDVAAALAGVEASIADGRLDDATAGLAQVARALLAQAPEPMLLARATWLAGAVALRDGDQPSFAALTQDAIEGLRLAGDDARAASAAASRAEIVTQLADARRVQERGAAGLMEVLDRHAAQLLAIAATGGWGDPRWATVDRERALLPALIALAAATAGAPAPLAAVIDELELDPVESVLVATLASLARTAPATAPDRLARLCFGDWRSYDEALLRLRDDGRLARTRAIVGNERGELALHPALLERLRGPADAR